MNATAILPRIARLTGVVLAGCAAFAADAAAQRSGRAPLAFVSNEASHDISVVDLGARRVVATIPVGGRARGVQAAPGGRVVYVAVSDDSPTVESSADAIVAIDVATLRVTGRIEAGTDPEQLAVSTDGRRIFAANEDAGTATVIDLRTRKTLSSAVVGIEPEGVAASPDGRWVYVTAETSNSVSMVDARTAKVVGNVLVDVRPRAVAFSPDSRRAYVTAEIGGSLTALDTRRHVVAATVALEENAGKPVGVVVSRDGTRVFVANGARGTVSVVDAASLRVVQSIKVGSRPWGLALSPDGALLVTADGMSDQISIVDARTLKVVGRVAVGQRPWGVAIVAAGAREGSHR
ncbi:MAG TPA: cytochrome D1 domain-containing protein [Gemmatimonadaceae bacterium]|nr:cytochrome D1 domain-containing protein [Gemmatimonadaceae bacterium]